MTAFSEDRIDDSAQEPTEIRSHEIAHRKKIGAFYTPLSVSTLLSAWAIRASTDTVLEPCFGGCTFLEAAVARLSALGSDFPAANLFGCDIDPLAFSFLRERIAGAIGSNFFQQDFISFSPDKLPKRAVDVVIGNPPYIRNSNLSQAQRDLIKTCFVENGTPLHGRANLWAHFTVHAMRFVAGGGRMALVLPGSFLYADYSQFVQQHLLDHFKRVTAITVAERLFVTEGTEETTVVLLAEGYGGASAGNKLQVACVDSVDDLAAFIADTTSHGLLPDQPYAGHGMVPFDAARFHLELTSAPGMVSLGTLAKLNIGLVTGNTGFFIKSKHEWRAHSIKDHYLQYIFPKSQFVRGLVLDQATIDENISQGVRCLALAPPDVPREASLVAYLTTYADDARTNNATFRRRDRWHQIADSYPIPDAFFVFMSGNGPRIILNESGSTATNAVYRVYFHSGTTLTNKRMAAISIHTTFSQLGAELMGHARGSGALKLEPSAAARLMLYMPDEHSAAEVASAFFEVHTLLKAHDFDGARRAADSFLFPDPAFQEGLTLLNKGLMTVRARRSR